MRKWTTTCRRPGTAGREARWGIVIRVVLGFAGVALGAFIAFVAAGLWFFTAVVGGNWPFENVSVPTGVILSMLIAAAICASATLAAAFRPTKMMAAFGGSGLIVALVLVGYIVR